MEKGYFILRDYVDEKITGILIFPKDKFDEVQDAIYKMKEEYEGEYDSEDLWECLPDYVESLETEDKELEW